MAMSNKHIIKVFIILSFYNKLAISSDDKNFGSSSECSGNSTQGNPLFQNYEMSVSSLLSNLTLETKPRIRGYYNTSVGSGSGKAYGSYMCWGDISRHLCNKCVAYTTQALATQKFYEECVGNGNYLDSDVCLVHYRNQPVTMYKVKGDFSTTFGSSGGKVANYKEYNKTLSTAIQGLIKEAGFGNWTRTNLETRIVPVNGSEHQKIHILVQCIPVISAKDCSSCLGELPEYLPGCCNGTQDGVVIHANCCIIKYDNQSFIGGAYRSSNVNHFHVLLVLLVSVYFVI